MRIHHLSCGSLHPHGARLINGEGGWLAPGTIVCHCLLIEAGDGLVLVDTGYGMEDARDPGRLGTAYRALLRPEARPETTAAAQVEELGFERGDLRQIVTTHLDPDHAGGLPDFPRAEVHVLATELSAALHPSLRDRPRYRSANWAHGPRWVEHDIGGDDWFGFEGIRILPGIDAELLLIPLVGHSRGHTGVAVNTPDGWLLHCGDAYFHHDEIAAAPSCPPMLDLFQTVVAADSRARRHNRERLRELLTSHGDEVQLLSSHDPHELRLRQAVSSGTTPAE
ncbi:MAG TPA: MBL fold metallo-hydrolase [Solirubrobacterales bacterium]